MKNKTANEKSSFMLDSCQLNSRSDLIVSKSDGAFEAHMAMSPVKIDGCSKDSIWISMDWYGMNYKWMGESVDSLER